MWIAGCQTVPTLPEVPWLQQQAALRAIEHFEFTGRIAVANGSEGFSAGLRWQQHGIASDLSLTAPLGIGALQIQFDGDALRVVTSDGTRLEGDQADEALRRALGFEPPLQSLRYWLRGVSDPSQPADEVLGADQRLQSLQQAGWRIAYDEYRSTGQRWLPSRLVLNRDALRVRLVISRWQL